MRTDHDSLGSVRIPDDALYSSNTVRGAENFHLIGRAIRDYPTYIVTMAKIKKAAARANLACGGLSDNVASAICNACDELIGGQHHDNFIVSLAEGSGGTSTNMNFNEVIANRAGQILGGSLGTFTSVHPNDHVNMSQSTNDTVPTAVKLTCATLAVPLIERINQLVATFRKKADEYRGVLRVGRTCMQAAQPMTYGQMFDGYASSLGRAAKHLEVARLGLCAVPMGGTAIGTGLGAIAGYRERIGSELCREFGFEITLPEDYFDAMQSADGFVRFSSELKVLSETLGKIAGDFVILGSGGKSGLGEIVLPSVQPGSSIMPGKINPVICMMVQQLTYIVHGHDSTVSIAALNGQLEINHFEPVIAHALFNAVDLLTTGCDIFCTKCVSGIKVDEVRSFENLSRSSAMSTVFVPELGYSRVSALVKEAERTGDSLAEIAISQGLLSHDSLKEILTSAAGGKNG